MNGTRDYRYKNAIKKFKKELIGKRFGRWIIKDISYKKQLYNNYNYLAAYCKCDCGIERWTRVNSLKKGDSKSCGCLHREIIGKWAKSAFTTHGVTKNPMFNTWLDFNNRCFNNKIECFYDYGGRGIIVCDEWKHEKFGGLSLHQGLFNFIQWAEAKALKQGIFWEDILYKKVSLKSRCRLYSIHRIDNDGPYAPWNCKWVTRPEQDTNKRKRISNYQHDNLKKVNLALLRENDMLHALLKFHKILK